MPCVNRFLPRREFRLNSGTRSRVEDHRSALVIVGKGFEGPCRSPHRHNAESIRTGPVGLPSAPAPLRRSRSVRRPPHPNIDQTVIRAKSPLCCHGAFEAVLGWDCPDRFNTDSLSSLLIEISRCPRRPAHQLGSGAILHHLLKASSYWSCLK
jgi:hypothetical protein